MSLVIKAAATTINTKTKNKKKTPQLDNKC